MRMSSQPEAMSRATRTRTRPLDKADFAPRQRKPSLRMKAREAWAMGCRRSSRGSCTATRHASLGSATGARYHGLKQRLRSLAAPPLAGGRRPPPACMQSRTGHARDVTRAALSVRARSVAGG